MKTNPRLLEQQLAWRSLMMVALPGLLLLPLLALARHAPARAAADAPLFTMAREPLPPCRHTEALAAAESPHLPPIPRLEPMVLSPIPAWQEFNSPIRGIETPPLCAPELSITSLPSPRSTSNPHPRSPAPSSQIVHNSTSYIVHSPRPPYPESLRRRRISGSVGVRISVSPQGIPSAVDITHPSGHAEFDSTTRSWILRHWRFHPATSGGRPIASHVTTTVHFRLR